MIKDSIKRIREVANTLEDDDPDKIEMLNTEGDYSSLIEWALIKRYEYLATAESCKTLVDRYSKRKSSFENKADSMKDIIGWIMKEAQENKYKGPSGTVTIGQKKKGVIVTDETKIPDRFFKTERKLMKSELNKAVLDGEAIEGALLDNGGEQITIR